MWCGIDRSVDPERLADWKPMDFDPELRKALRGETSYTVESVEIWRKLPRE